MSPRVSVRLLQAQSDRRLLELVGRGYERAFEAVVLRHRPPLLAYCRRLGLSEQRAEDVVQQALLKAWLALREGAVVRDARPWLFRITHNTAINSMRARDEDTERVDAEALVAIGADSAFERGMAARDALSGVASLPPMQRDVVLLSAIDGRSHAEVADALGISSGAVRGLLFRARAALRGAAAALTPPPLLAWAAGAGGTPTAGRLLEISASGGGDLGAGLFKGAALGITAALAAGAVIVPRAVGGSHARGQASVASARAGSADGARAPTSGAAAGVIVPELWTGGANRGSGARSPRAGRFGSSGRDGAHGRRDGAGGSDGSAPRGGSGDGSQRGSTGRLDTGGSRVSQDGARSGAGGTGSGDTGSSSTTTSGGSQDGGTSTGDSTGSGSSDGSVQSTTSGSGTSGTSTTTTASETEDGGAGGGGSPSPSAGGLLQPR